MRTATDEDPESSESDSTQKIQCMVANLVWNFLRIDKGIQPLTSSRTVAESCPEPCRVQSSCMNSRICFDSPIQDSSGLKQFLTIHGQTDQHRNRIGGPTR